MEKITLYTIKHLLYFYLVHTSKQGLWIGLGHIRMYVCMYVQYACMYIMCNNKLANQGSDLPQSSDRASSPTKLLPVQADTMATQCSPSYSAVSALASTSPF